MKMQRKRVSSMMNGVIDGMKNRLKRQVNGKIDGMKAEMGDRTKATFKKEEGVEGDEGRSNGRRNEKTPQSIAYGTYCTNVSLKDDLSDSSFSDSEMKGGKDGME